MPTTFRYQTAHAAVMVGSVSGPSGLTPRRIGPAHATISKIDNRRKKALCGAFVSTDDHQDWPPVEHFGGLCPECAILAAL